MIGVIYKNNKEIDRGIIVSGKHYCKDYPEQSISICDRADSYSIQNEREYTHGNEIRFEEYQDGKKVYCSIEKIDRTKCYGIPNWFCDSTAPIPNVEVSLDNSNKEHKKFKGYIE